MDTLYAAPRLVIDPSECHWYHTMDLPGLGSVAGDWDLRATIDDYLGGVDFSGKRCLDIGAASGYLTFEMERRGATEVVSVDIDLATHEWEIVPFATPGYDVVARGAAFRHRVETVQRSYWLAHRVLGSNARMHYGSAYSLPVELGRFDVVLIGMMLPHVRDPFRVLEQAAARCADTIIVTQPAPQMPGAWAYFMPDPRTHEPFNAWWSMSEDCVDRMLSILGFEVVAKSRAEHACPLRGDSESCTAIIASRITRRA